MKQLSYWASTHRHQARLMIVACYILANLLGDIWALWLYAEGIRVSAGSIWALVFISILVLLIHPRSGRKRSRHYSYALHKGCDMALCLATVALVAGTTINTLKLMTPVQASVEWRREAPAAQEAKKESRVEQMLHRVTHWYSETPVWAKVLLVVLAVVVTVVLGIFWGAICCEISCGGAETLAIILLVLGWGGLLTGAFFVCRRIIRGPKGRVLRAR